MTDATKHTEACEKQFKKHSTIRHSWGIYSRKEGNDTIHANTVEGFFSLLKRGVIWVFHHVSKHHLHRYLSEFDFRYNARKIIDGERAVLAVTGSTGKRLTYRDSRGSAQGRVSQSN